MERENTTTIEEEITKLLQKFIEKEGIIVKLEIEVKFKDKNKGE